MASGDLLTAARYNNLQTAIANVYGNGAGNTGYGQTVSSSQVPGGNVKLVEATDMQKLYDDIVACRVHQTGLIPSEIANILSGDTVTDDDGGTDTPGVLPADGDKKGYVDYESLVTTMASTAERFKLAGTQAEQLPLRTSSNALISQTRSTNFQTQLVHEFSVNFSTYDHARHFFNSGGQIIMSASVPDGTGKQHDWYMMLANMGEIRFGHTATTSEDPDADGDGQFLTRTTTPTNIGFYDLTTSYQTVFSKTGETGSVYAENDYTVKAKGDAIPADANKGNVAFPYAIQLRVEFNDDDIGDDRIPDGYTYRTDETVNNPISSNVEYRRASGDYVDVPAPVGIIIAALTGS